MPVTSVRGNQLRLDTVTSSEVKDASLLDIDLAPQSSTTLQGNTFNAADRLVQVLSDGKLPALDGSNLTGLSISESIASSDLTDFEGAVNAANGAVKLDGSGNLPALDGSALTGISAGVELGDSPTWTGTHTFDDKVTLKAGSLSSPSIFLDNSGFGTLGIYSGTADTIDFASGNTLRLSINASGITSTVKYQTISHGANGNGSAYRIGMSGGVGIYRSGDKLGFSANNGHVGFLSTSGFEISVPIKVQGMKSGATQVAASAAVGELWKTSSHATLPDNVVMIGV